eukprot:m.91543 g.91543  ORF g.91543 m.91543 type:complete len:401 (+) comp18227_c0_seq1:233-1435(+)
MLTAGFFVVALLCCSAAAVPARRTVGCESNPCSQHADCTPDQVLGYQCTCKSGFTGDGLTCTDIDECAVNNGGCEQNCKNLLGTYWCTCHSGFRKVDQFNCEEQVADITGTVISSRNKTHIYSNVPVLLYSRRSDGSRGPLQQETTSTPYGVYHFEVNLPGSYLACAIVESTEACVVRTVQPEWWMDNLAAPAARRRRTTNLALLDIPIPGYLQVGEYEIQLIWAMDAGSAHCDWDTVLFTEYDSSCIAAYKDTQSYGFCCDPNSVDCERYATVYQDSDCTYDTFGFETIVFSEQGTASYKHMVYGYGTGSSFDPTSALSQGLVNVYRRGILGLPFLEDQINLADASIGHSDARFWHTFTLTTSAGAFGSVSETNMVSCSPAISTGTNDTLSFENGSRVC